MNENIVVSGSTKHGSSSRNNNNSGYANNTVAYLNGHHKQSGTNYEREVMEKLAK